MDPGFPNLFLTENSCSKQQGNTLLPGFIDSSLLCHSFNLFVTTCVRNRTRSNELIDLTFNNHIFRAARSDKVLNHVSGYENSIFHIQHSFPTLACLPVNAVLEVRFSTGTRALKHSCPYTHYRLSSAL